MINFYQFLEVQQQVTPPPTPIIQRAVPVGGFGGWKIHLRTGTNDSIRSVAYMYVKEIIKANGNKWNSKMLDGGEPNEKDITIYCGPKREAVRAAVAITNHEELFNILRPPGKEILQDDILIHKDLPNIYGRFNASIGLNTAPFEFHQYGCKGWSMLANDMQKLSQARSLKNPKNSHLVKKLKDMGSNFDINFDLEQGKKDACERSYKALASLFGKDFTG